MPETDKLLEQIAKLLMSAQRKAMRSQHAETNFRVSQLISEACRDQVEDVVSIIAARISQKGIFVSVNFLFDAYRIRT